MNKSILLLIIAFGIFACNDFKKQGIPDEVARILNKAGSNRNELLKVINHYKGDSLKLKAAYFLIANMDDKYALGGEDLRNYDPIFNFFGELNKKNLQTTAASVYVNSKWDSLVSLLGPFDKKSKEIYPDYKKIKAGFLIDNIDQAFAARDSSAWLQKMNFTDFCEYMVSYRFSHEPLEEWRSFYRNKYKIMFDTLKKDSCRSYASKIHKLTPRIFGSGWFMQYPFDFWVEQMEASRMGTCVQIATYRAQLMRSAGIPTAIDFTLNWGNHGAGHTWNTIFPENGKPLHMEGTALELGQDLVYKVAKVYRKTFGRQETGYGKNENEIPPEVRNHHMIDVTKEYTKTADISVPLKYKPERKKRYAVICSHNNKKWIPQDWGEIRSGKARFRNMGVGNIYNVMYYEDGALSSANDPFILNEKGEIVCLTTMENRTQDMHLLRKYPLRKSIQAYHEGVVGCFFQGANKVDFRDSVILHTIKKSYDQLVNVDISNPKKFRYVRFKSPIHFKGDIAEIEFYGGDKSIDTIKLTGKIIGFPEVPKTFGTVYQNALDGNIDTYFHGYWDSKLWWAGLDLGEPKIITKIRYCPRSDTNFIVEGDMYELCYWKRSQWISMGEQVAKIPSLEYKNVPKGGLYILHNLSRGKEERIFTYQEGKQVFW